MKNSILLIVAVIISLTAFGQTEKTPAIRIADLGIYNGINNFSNSDAGLNEFIKLAPTSDMLSNDFTGYTKSNSYNGISTSDNVFTINLGFLFYNKEKQSYNSNPKLNIGVSFISASSLSAFYSISQSKRFDTLKSEISTNMVFIDSVSNRSYAMNYLYQQIGLNTNLIFRTKPEALLSLYGGVGIFAMTSLLSETHISYNFSSSINYVLPGHDSGYLYSDSDENDQEKFDEIYKNKTNISLFAYVPLGIDFRLSKNHEFWNKMHLILEMQPGLAIDYVPELGTKIQGNTRANFGIRIEI